MSNKILIVAGDPNSINSEIIFKSWKKLDIKIKRNIYIIANYNLIYNQFKRLKLSTSLLKRSNLNDKPSNHFKIIDMPLYFKNPFKVLFNEASKYVINSLNLAHDLAIKKRIKGIINCPIDKRLIKTTKKIGVTEFLANKCRIKNKSEVMMIHNQTLSVVPITTHIDIKNVEKNISSKIILKKITTLNTNFKKIFKKKPKIAVLGLNPHNSEMRNLSFEKSKILPAIKKLKDKGFRIHGPLVADTIFMNNYKNYDVIVGMYHDQVLAPFKALFHFNAINITLGLNYIRVSPDHGTGADIIGKNKANYLSLFECIRFINKLK
jgi:4-hydroxythreonine-4-phosphate dehydrogenase